jgi:hypothetical protein
LPALAQCLCSLTSLRSRRSHELRESHATRSMPSWSREPHGTFRAPHSSTPARPSARGSRRGGRSVLGRRRLARRRASSQQTSIRRSRCAVGASPRWLPLSYTGCSSSPCCGSHRAHPKPHQWREASPVWCSWLAPDLVEGVGAVVCEIQCRRAPRKHHPLSAGRDRLQMPHPTKLRSEPDSLKCDAPFQLPSQLRLRSSRTRFHPGDSLRRSQRPQMGSDMTAWSSRSAVRPTALAPV